MSRARTLALALVAVAVAAGPAAGQGRAPRPRRVAPAAAPSSDVPVLALVGATVHTGVGAPLENATVVVRGDRIVSVTAGGGAPAGAETLDVRGAVVTAGLVATESPLGLVEIPLEASTSDASPEGGDADPIRAAFRAADGINPGSTLLPVARLAGVTSAVSTPTGGLVSGTSAWIDTLGEAPADLLVSSDAALHVSLADDGVSAAGGAMSAAIGRLRELLDDARLYARQRAAYDRRALREMPVSRLDLERVTEALAGRLPVVVRVDRSSDILRVLALGREYGLRLVLAGVAEGWRVAAAIAAAQVPVILEPMQNLPSTFSQLGSRFDNAALLAAAGVRVALTSGGAHDARRLRQEAGNAVAWGLPWDVALRAVTLEPARIFGLDRDYGTVEAGKVANLVVWSGDPFELGTRATLVLVRGRRAPMESRQTALLARYRDLSRVPAGHPARREGAPGSPPPAASPAAEP